MRHLFVPFGLKPKKPIDPDAPRYADMYPRAVAMAIDILPLMLLFSGISDYAMVHIYDAFGQLPLVVQSRPRSFDELFGMIWAARYPWLLHNLFVLLLIAVPYVVCQIRFGTTPGRWLLGLKIVQAESMGPPTRAQYIVRFLGYALAPGMLLAAFNKKHRALHDYIAGTAVLNTRPDGWYWGQLKRGVKWALGTRGK